MGSDGRAKMTLIVLVALAFTGCADTRTFKNETPTTVYYQSCDDAPSELHQGDPGYRLGLDRDRDGTACDGG